MVAQYKGVAEAGTLLTFAPRATEGYRRAAGYVDKILKREAQARTTPNAPTARRCCLRRRYSKLKDLLPHPCCQVPTLR